MGGANNGGIYIEVNAKVGANIFSLVFVSRNRWVAPTMVAFTLQSMQKLVPTYLALYL